MAHGRLLVPLSCNLRMIINTFCQLLKKVSPQIYRAVTKFTEDFDFIGMNEKFKKDEVWGHLGKSKAHLRDNGDGRGDDEEDNPEEDDSESSKIDIKPVYVKDDFFDSLSCNALDQGTRNGRTKFSEQIKIDTETFGDFPRHRGGRGGWGPVRGGRSRGAYYGRGYGYVGRGGTRPFRNGPPS
ncbi:protein decapping 5-like [Tasmannia lanceolata]|uniref:protein decapping 5-like n=1 Tax=Tasmannia lanceolata TaxID=3420 RepID=UPI0040649054